METMSTGVKQQPSLRENAKDDEWVIEENHSQLSYQNVSKGI